MVHLKVHLSVQLRTPKGVLQDLYKLAQEGTFEVEIKDALEVTIELHLKMHMVVHLLVEKSAQKDPMAGEFEEALYVTLESTPKI